MAPRPRKSLVALACAFAVTLALPVAAQAFPPVGISDQSPDTFSEPGFKSLGTRLVRLVTPWDQVLIDPKPLDDWLAAAHAAGQEPFVEFEHSYGQYCPSSECIAPEPDAYAQAFDAFRTRYPWVTTFSPWNEANHLTQPTSYAPGLAAAYYNVMAAHCPECTIVAADVLSEAGLADWLTAFRQNVNGYPLLWGLHNYSDVNRFRTSDTDEFLQMVPGDVWLTETGGIVYFRTASGTVTLPYDEFRAASAVDFLFDLVAPRERITRVYVYQWRKNPAPTDRFDAGLTREDGSPRPALDVLRARLGSPADGGSPTAGPGDVRLEGFGDPASIPRDDAGVGAKSRDGTQTFGGKTGRLPRRLVVRRDGTLRIRVLCLQPGGCALSLRVVTAGTRAVTVARGRMVVHGIQRVKLHVAPIARRLAAREAPSRGLLVRAQVRVPGGWRRAGLPARLIFRR